MGVSPMGVSPADFEILRTIVGNASTLPERISPAIVATDTGDDSQANVELLHHWSETVLGTDMATLEQRLGWDGLTLEAVQQAFGPAAPQADQPLPDWAQTLHRIITSGVALPQPSNRTQDLGRSFSGSKMGSGRTSAW